MHSLSSLKVLKELCCANLANTKAEIYGSKTCERIELVQAHILNKIAYSINAVAENEVIPRYVSTRIALCLSSLYS